METVTVEAWVTAVGAAALGAAAAIVSAYIVARRAERMAARQLEATLRFERERMEAILGWERERMETEGNRLLRDRDAAFKRERYTRFLTEMSEVDALLNSIDHHNLKDAEAPTRPEAASRADIAEKFREASAKSRQAKSLATEMSLYAPTVAKAADHYWTTLFSRRLRQSQLRRAINNATERPVVVAERGTYRGIWTEASEARVTEARRSCRTAMRADLGIPEPPPEVEETFDGESWD